MTVDKKSGNSTLAEIREFQNIEISIMLMITNSERLG
jgi:hypothetical protein